MRSAAVAAALSFGEKIMYRFSAEAFRTVETCVADEALPASAPVKVVALTLVAVSRPLDGVYVSAVPVLISVAVAAPLTGTNVAYCAVVIALFVDVTFVVVAALPVSAPLSVVAVTVPTLNTPDDGTYESAVAVWMSAGAPPVVLLFGVTHRYRMVDALVFAVTTCDASDARPVKVGAVISPVARIFGTRSVAPPVSPGV
jgi:hypothetical protein